MIHRKLVSSYNYIEIGQSPPTCVSRRAARTPTPTSRWRPPACTHSPSSPRCRRCKLGQTRFKLKALMSFSVSKLETGCAFNPQGQACTSPPRRRLTPPPATPPWTHPIGSPVFASLPVLLQHLVRKPFGNVHRTIDMVNSGY